MKLYVIGGVLIVIGIIDYGLYLMGVDLTGWIVGSTLSEYTPVFFGGLGAVLLAIAANKAKESEILTDLNENEVLLKKGSVVMKHSTFKQENGVLILTNQRLIYKGTSSQNVDIGSKDIEIPVQNISKAKGFSASMLVTEKDGTETTIMVGIGKVQPWVKEVSEVI